MSDQAKQMNLNIDLKNTTVVETKEGNVVFQQGVILRRVSKFVVGADEDVVIPIPVFYDPISGKLLKDTVPAELRKDYEDHMIDG
jgi:hypothetical protein